HTRADVLAALRILDDAGIPMRPTFVAFTPWTTAQDYLDVLDFIAEHGLEEHVDPIQYAIRLLVPPESALLDNPDETTWLGLLDEAALSYTWAHPDPRMDTLQCEVQALVECAANQREPIPATFAAIRQLAAERLGVRVSELVGAGGGRGDTDGMGVLRRARRPVPHLSEPWFC
ncbi:MAG TPA: CUAEP/CCAEP-tail radical SAM protein, partial [Ktedonobacterales bacterium]|nr:CUAEP/CCAEP-tail radical SAM protein [Ktedonobacterales bacterium]